MKYRWIKHHWIITKQNPFKLFMNLKPLESECKIFKETLLRRCAKMLF